MVRWLKGTQTVLIGRALEALVSVVEDTKNLIRIDSCCGLLWHVHRGKRSRYSHKKGRSLSRPHLFLVDKTCGRIVPVFRHVTRLVQGRQYALRITGLQRHLLFAQFFAIARGVTLLWQQAVQAQKAALLQDEDVLETQVREKQAEKASKEATLVELLKNLTNALGQKNQREQEHNQAKADMEKADSELANVRRKIKESEDFRKSFLGMLTAGLGGREGVISQQLSDSAQARDLKKAKDIQAERANDLKNAQDLVNVTEQRRQNCQIDVENANATLNSLGQRLDVLNGEINALKSRYDHLGVLSVSS